MSPNGGSDLRKPHVLPVYDQRQQKFIHDERRRNKGVRCDDRLSSIFPLHNIGYKSAGSTDRNCSRMTFTVRASRIAARMLALPVTAIWTTQFWITRRPRYTEFITGELHAQTEARCDAGPRRIYAASHSAVSAGGGYLSQLTAIGRGQSSTIMYPALFCRILFRRLYLTRSEACYAFYEFIDYPWTIYKNHKQKKKSEKLFCAVTHYFSFVFIFF
jgi:hypothetical protein